MFDAACGGLGLSRSPLFGGALAAVLLAGVLKPLPSWGGTPGDLQAVHRLSNGRLTAEVMEPAHPARYNRGVRFTPLAAILRLSLDGHSFLYAPEAHDPVGDHGGLAVEFDLSKPDALDADLPPGYLEAAPGEGFIKVGVGVLAKMEERYTLFQQCPVLEAAPITVEWGGDHAVFRQACSGTNGYSYQLEARVRLEETRAVIDWKLTNTGVKPLATKQYVHNFFCFDEQPTGPGYVLSFPYDFQATGLKGGQVQKGRAIDFIEPIPRLINAFVAWPEAYSGPNTLLLRNTHTGQAVRCTTSVPGLVTAIHARTRYISPEQFILITVEPGKSQAWSRIYQFEVASPAARQP